MHPGKRKYKFMTTSNKVKGFAAGIVAAVCYGTNPLGTLQL